MVQTNRVAVLMAVYNGERWLARQLDTVLAQTGIELTLFVSIDRSNDDSAAVCERYAAQDARVVLLPAGLKHGSASRNFFHLLSAVDLAGFDYVAFADQDDIWADNKLLMAIETMCSEGVDGYSGNVDAFWSDGRTALIDKAQPQQRWDYLFEAAGPGCTYVMSARLAQEICGELRVLGARASAFRFHDWFCYALARGRGYRWYIDHRSFMRYRQHDSNAVGVNQGVQPFLQRVRHVLASDSMGEARELAQTVFRKDFHRVAALFPASAVGYLKLALRAKQCRRRQRDQVFFFGYCVFQALAALLSKPSAD